LARHRNLGDGEWVPLLSQRTAELRSQAAFSDGTRAIGSLCPGDQHGVESDPPPLAADPRTDALRPGPKEVFQRERIVVAGLA
jgi:hypothetical protein